MTSATTPNGRAPCGKKRPPVSGYGVTSFTSGQVARIFRISPRTASKWIDCGLLPGCRIPGSQDRRVRREELVAFAQAQGLSHFLDGLGARVLLAGCPRLGAAFPEADGWSAACAADGFDVGRACAQRPPDIAVLDCGGLGRSEALALARRLRAVYGCPVVLLANEDEADEEALLQAASEVFRKPFDPALLAGRVGALLA